MLDGWEESDGVQAELCIARQLGEPVRYLAVEDAFAASRWPTVS